MPANEMHICYNAHVSKMIIQGVKPLSYHRFLALMNNLGY